MRPQPRLASVLHLLPTKFDGVRTHLLSKPKISLQGRQGSHLRDDAVVLGKGPVKVVVVALELHLLKSGTTTKLDGTQAGRAGIEIFEVVTVNILMQSACFLDVHMVQTSRLVRPAQEGQGSRTYMRCVHACSLNFGRISTLTRRKTYPCQFESTTHSCCYTAGSILQARTNVR